MKDRIIIGTRRSRLALIQTEIVERLLRAAWPGLTIAREEIVTRGDRDRKTPLAQADEPGLFTRAIETRLLEGGIDLAVHSFKDLPVKLPEGLMIAATPPRADPRDALVFFPGRGGPMCPPSSGQRRNEEGPHIGGPLHKLREGAAVGTSSPRRSAQLLAIRPDLAIKDLRGNVDTRLAKLARGDYDAIIVAKAALDRLAAADGEAPACAPAAASGEEGRHVGPPLQQATVEVLNPGVLLPAPAQGALAVECREGDLDAERIAGAINDAETFVAASAERALLAALGGGCRLALGALADVTGEGPVRRSLGEGGSLRLRAAVLSADGRRAARAEARGPVDDPARVVEDCRRQLLEGGAGELLR